MKHPTKQIIQNYKDIIWRKSFTQVDPQSQQCMIAYTWCGCLMLVQLNTLGAIVRKEFIAPNGAFFDSERKFATYMGINIKSIRTSKSDIEASCFNCSHLQDNLCNCSSRCVNMDKWDYKFNE